MDDRRQTIDDRRQTADRSLIPGSHAPRGNDPATLCVENLLDVGLDAERRVGVLTLRVGTRREPGEMVQN